MPIGLANNPLQELAVSWDAAVSCLNRLTAQNGAIADIPATRRRSEVDPATVPLSQLVELAGEFGLHAEWIELDWQTLKTTGFARPLLILRKDGDLVMVTGGGRSGIEEVSVWDPQHDGVVFFVPREDLERAWNGYALVITPAEHVPIPLDSRPGDKTTADTGDDAATTLLPRRSSRRLLCGAAIAAVAAASIGAFLLTYSDADHLAATGIATKANSGTPLNRENAAPSGAAATVVIGRIPEPTSASASPAPSEPIVGRTSSDPPPQVAPQREASPPASPAEAPPSTVPAAPAPEATPSVAALVTPATADRPPLSSPEIAALLARGDALVVKGDVAAARLFYERAVDAGDGQAAIRLGETFDPVFLDHAQLRGVRGDVVAAVSWYRRARELGAIQAEVLLESLEGKKEQ